MKEDQTPLPFEIISVHAVYSTVDDRGRRGGIVAISESRHTAEAMAEGKGWYGGQGDIAETKAIRVGDEVLLLQSTTRYPLDTDFPAVLQQRKAAARAKLTNEEAELLGIK